MTFREQSAAKAAKIANAILAGGGAASLLVLLYFSYQYAWTGTRQFAGAVGVLLYYVLPAVVAGFLLGSLKFKPAYKINLAILCFSLIASVYSIEIFLRVSDFSFLKPRQLLMGPIVWGGTEKEKQKAVKLAKQFGVDIDTRDRFEVIADLRKRGVDAIPSAVSKQDLLIKQSNGSVKSVIDIHGAEVIPLGWIADKVTVLCNETGSWVTYQSDEYGFVNPKGIWGEHRIAVAAIGDSYAHGHCVQSDKSIVALIQQRFPATLNLGMSGNGPLLELAVLKEYLPPVKPKVVLWFYFEGNDLSDLQNEKNSPLLMRYLKYDFNQGLLARQHDIDLALAEYVEKETAREVGRRARKRANTGNVIHKLLEIGKLSDLRQRLSLVHEMGADELDSLSDSNMDLFREVLSEAKTCVGTWGGTLYFVYLPIWQRYGYGDPGPSGKQRPKVLELVGQLGIPIIDMHPAFQAQSDPLSLFPFREPGHYGDKGHQVVAEQVLKAISNARPDSQ